jgi:hypothetical protein
MTAQGGVKSSGTPAMPWQSHAMDTGVSRLPC